MRALLALLLFAGPLLGQAANGWAPIENGWGEVQIPSSTSAPSGLTSGRVTLSTGATAVGDDAGCTWTGTGSSFVATFGAGVVVGTGTRTAPSISFAGGSNYGVYADLPNGALLWVTNATQQISVGAGAVSMGPSETLGWVAATNTLSSTLQDTAFRRVSAGVLALGAGPTGFAAEFTTGTHSTQTANGAKENWGQTSELVTLDTGGTSTVTAGNLAPANAIIDSITYRITTTIATATDFTIKVTGGNAFSSIGTATTSQTTLTSGTTGVLVPSAFADQYNTSATTLTVTTTGTPSAGVVRITTNWRVFVPPTS